MAHCSVRSMDRALAETIAIGAQWFIATNIPTGI
jgi:hypothetical protein